MVFKEARGGHCEGSGQCGPQEAMRWCGWAEQRREHIPGLSSRARSWGVGGGCVTNSEKARLSSGGWQKCWGRWGGVSDLEVSLCPGVQDCGCLAKSSDCDL